MGVKGIYIYHVKLVGRSIVGQLTIHIMALRKHEHFGTQTEHFGTQNLHLSTEQ